MVEQGDRHSSEMSQEPGQGRKVKISADGGAKNIAEKVHSMTAQILVLALLLTSYGYEIRQTASFLQTSKISQLVNKI